MPGESDLNLLLQTMRPVLHPAPFTFCTITSRDFASLPAPVLGSALGLFRESEGVTVILPVVDAKTANLVMNGA